MYERPTGAWKGAEHKHLLGKCKLKPQWDTSHLLGGLLSQKEIEKDNSKCWRGCEEVGTLVDYRWEHKMS